MTKASTTKNGRLDLAEILVRPKSLTIAWEDLTLNISYNRAVASHRRIKEMNLTGEGEANEESTLLLLQEVLLTWDIQADGVPYPINRDNLEALPSRLLVDMVNAIFEDLNPNPVTATP